MTLELLTTTAFERDLRRVRKQGKDWRVIRNDPFDLNYETVDGEERWTAIGHTNDLRVLLLVWTLRGEDLVRVVTAREASKAASVTYLREKGFGL